MNNVQLNDKIERIIADADTLIAGFLKDPIDFGISEGNVSICIVDEHGRVYGKMWGKDKNRQRNTFQTAWRKASQVWITGTATGRFERLVYTDRVDLRKFGLQNPDLIGWEGGWPVSIEGEIRLAVAVSGMRGEKDTELVFKAVGEIGEIAKS